MSEGTKNIFISHVHEDDAEVQRLRELLAGKGYDLRDSSVDSSNPNNASSHDYIKSGILAPRIQWAGTVVVLISPDTHQSQWVNWEIEYAEKQGKRVVGVYVHGGKESDIPAAFELYGQALVGWQADRIMGAINGTINNWETPDGAVREERVIPRFRCSR